MNAYLLPQYELRFRIDKFNYEVIGSWFQRSLAYGIRKKLIREQPEKYPFNKLIVKTITMKKREVKYDGTCLTINTDASYCGQTGAAGWAFWIVCDQFVLKESGEFKTHTENSTHAEVKCIGNALYRLVNTMNLPKVKWLIINTDSMVGIQNIKQGHGNGGKDVSWLYHKLVRKLECRKHQFRHVKAHSGKDDRRSKVNEWCDEEAKKHMRLLREKLKQGNNG